MYQSLSHELKTPITVISSYVEAANDKIITYEDAVKKTIRVAHKAADEETQKKVKELLAGKKLNSVHDEKLLKEILKALA